MKQHHSWNGSTMNAISCRSSPTVNGLLRGPAAGMSLSAVFSSPQTRMESQLFRVLLLRRLRLPLPLASRLWPSL